MNEVEEYIISRPQSQKELLLYLHELIMPFTVRCKLNYGIPFYYRQKWMVYLNPQKRGGVEVVFLNGNRFQNCMEYLEAKNRKMVRGITFLDLEDVNEQILRSCLEEAVRVDEGVKES